MSEITRLLEGLQEGDPKPSTDLLPLVYAELRTVAAWHKSREVPGHTLQLDLRRGLAIPPCPGFGANRSLNQCT